MRHFLFALIWAQVTSLTLGESEKSQSSDTQGIFQYLDDHGVRQFATDLRDVLPHKRSSALCVGGDCLKKSASSGSPTEVYHYKNKAGRDVYVDQRARVPGNVPLDMVELAGVPLHKEVATTLKRDLERQHKKLSQSATCRQANAQAQKSELALAWDHHGHLLTIAALMLLLLLITPAMLKRVDPPAWARLLTFALPALLAIGFVTHTVIQAQRTLRQTHQLSKLCEPALLESEDNPLAQVQLVQRLRNSMKQAQQNRQHVLDEALQ